MLKFARNFALKTTRSFNFFCLNTNLHGFAYIAQPSRKKVERIFWSLLIFIALILTGILIKKLVSDSEKNPIVIYTDQNVVSVQSLYFPAVSICPGLILRTPRRRILDYREILREIIVNGKDDYYKRMTTEELKWLQIVSLIQRDGYVAVALKNVTIDTSDMLDLMFSTEPFFFTTVDFFTYETRGFFEATWLRNFYASFTQTLFRRGFCYTFNHPPSEEMFYIDKVLKYFNYKNHTPSIDPGKFLTLNATPPFKSPLPGDGLSIKYHDRIIHWNQTVLKADEDMQADRFDILNSGVPITSHAGQLMIVHDPREVVPFNARSLFVNVESTVRIGVTPIVRKIDDNLKSKGVKERNCYLPNERKLKFMRTYTRVNCEHECLAHLTLNACGCVQFFMVHSKNTKICGAKDEICFRNVEANYEPNGKKCMCLENCESVAYETRIKSQERNEKGIQKLIDSKIIVEMSTNEVLAMSRKQSSTIIDLLSLSGGFLGLFAGFSVLSAAEIVYYFLISPILNYCARNSTRVYPIQVEEERKIENSALEYVKQTLQESSIHSVNHISNDQKSILERSVWSLLLIASMACTYFMVREIHGKTRTSGVAMMMEGAATKVEEIPFPAVTFRGEFCKDINGFLIEYYRIMGFSENLIDSTVEKYGDVSKQVQAFFCGGAVADKMFNVSYNFSSPNAFFEEYRAHMQRTSQDNWFRDKLFSWSRKENDTKPVTAQIATEFGIAHVFNLMESSKLLKINEVASDFHYKYSTNVSYPSHLSGDAAFNRLRVILIYKRRPYVCVKAAFAVHSPYEFPVAGDFYRYENRRYYIVQVSLTLTKADESLRALSIDTRKCYFSDERELKFFRVYTKMNCEFECMAQLLHERCRCVPFFYIRSPAWQVCEYKRMKLCVEKLLYERSIGNASESGNCNCLPTCNSVVYSYEVHEAKYKEEMWQHAIAVDFEHKNSEYFAMVRYQEFRIVDFLSYVGGILGLFAGISVLSFVEIAYFITLRLITDVRRRLCT